MNVTVASKEILDASTSASIQYDYEFTDLVGNGTGFFEYNYNYNTSTTLDDHFISRPVFKYTQGYKTTKVFQPQLNSTNRPYIIYRHYGTDATLQPNAPRDLYWGKVHKVENYDGNGNLISETENIYNYTLAFKKGATRGRNLYDQLPYTTDYDDYSDGYVPSQYSTTNIQWRIQDKLELKNLGGGYEGAKFLDIYFQDLIIAKGNGNPHYATYFNSYFVKKTSEINKVYEASCPQVVLEGEESPRLIPLNYVVETQTDYEYHEANYYGGGYNDALDEIADNNFQLIDGNNSGLKMEPSWQLYKKTTTSPQYPDAYTEERSYYYYDLVNSPIANYSVRYRTMDFTALETVYRNKLRNIPFETRTTVKTPNKAPVTQATYYEYKGDWDNYYVDYVVASDTTFSPDYPCSVSGNTMPSNCIIANSTMINANGGAALDGYQLNPNYAPYGWVYCPCNCGGAGGSGSGFGGGAGGVLAAAEFYNPKNIFLKAVYTQVAEYSSPSQPILNFVQSGNDYILDFGTIKVLKIEEVLERNRLGLVHQIQDVNGIITRYNYVPIYKKHYRYCHPTYPNTSFYTVRTLNLNSGMIQSVTIGQGRADSLVTNYTYNKDNTIATITDANGGILSYSYDEYGRMISASHNGDLLSEVDYHQWENDFAEDFETRTMGNYVQTTTHNDLSGTNFTRARAYLDPLGRTALTAAYASNNPNRLIISGFVEHDSWNREYKAYKPFTSNNTTFGNLNYNTAKYYATSNGSLTGTYSFTEQLFEDNPRSRVLKSAKFGLDINGNKTVNHNYCVVDGVTFANELNLTTTEQNAITPLTATDGSSILASTYIFLKTTIADEDGKWVTEYTNSIGQKVAILRNDGISNVITLFNYDRKGNLTKVINPEKQETNYRYNYLGQLYEEETVDGGKKQFIYNRKGQVVFERDAQGISNNYCRGYIYDDYGRLLRQAKVDISSTSVLVNPFLNYNSNPTDLSLLFLNAYENTLKNMPQSNLATPEKAWIYEDNINFTDASFIENARIYLQNSLTNYKGQVTQTISYDLFGAPIEYRFFSYNDRGQLKWEITQFNNNGISNKGKGLMTRIDYPKYNLRGSLQTMNVDLDGNHDLDLQYHYTYDQWNRLNEVFVSYNGQEQNGTKVAQYYYDDALGHVKKVEYYDDEGNCTKLIDATTYQYDVRDRLTKMDSRLFRWDLYYDDIALAFAPNANNSWNGNIKGSKALYKFGANTYTITNVTNLTNFTGQDQSQYDYTYDNLNRLISANAKHTGLTITGNLNDLGDVTYAYDKIGNITNLTRKEINNTNTLVTTQYSYNYLAGTNRLMAINIPQANTMVTDRVYTYDDNGNLKSDSKKGMVNTVYGRANLPWTINMSNTGVSTSTGAINSEIDYLYDVNDSRLFKTKTEVAQNAEGGVVTLSEYYLKSSSGQDLGIYDFNSDELTWYVFGKERIAKFKHQYENVLKRVGTGDVGFIAQSGDNQDLINALTPMWEYNEQLQHEDFRLPNTLLLINLTNSNTNMYILQTELNIITEPYTIVASYNLTEETNQFAFTMTDGSVGYFSIAEILGLIGMVPEGFTLTSGIIDPFNTPLTVPTTVHEPDFHYYIYDHLGNTRIVYSTTIPNCTQNPHYTLEAVMDYFPYGKILRQFIKTPEKYVTTGHERD
ncbi:MAG: hypothetical protein HC803_01795, partial [Saprospiraceae bacterium]|nr:hypothetical protein [Saprospiraceae bacterium]